MSEIAKCPLCGNSQVETLNEYTTPNGAYCCGVRCDSLEKWNRYAAAMELAKVCVNVDAAMRTDIDYDKMAELYENFSNAESRVLEVF